MPTYMKQRSSKKNAVKQLNSSVGGLRYYRKFRPAMVNKTRPTVALLKKGTVLNFTPEMKAITRELLADIAPPPVLVYSASNVTLAPTASMPCWTRSRQVARSDPSSISAAPHLTMRKTGSTFCWKSVAWSGASVVYAAISSSSISAIIPTTTSSSKCPKSESTTLAPSAGWNFVAVYVHARIMQRQRKIQRHLPLESFPPSRRQGTRRPISDRGPRRRGHLSRPNLRFNISDLPDPWRWAGWDTAPPPVPTSGWVPPKSLYFHGCSSMRVAGETRRPRHQFTIISYSRLHLRLFNLRPNEDQNLRSTTTGPWLRSPLHVPMRCARRLLRKRIAGPLPQNPDPRASIIRSVQSLGHISWTRVRLCRRLSLHPPAPLVLA